MNADGWRVDSSVSSVGSWALQPTTAIADVGWQSGLSVSSVGSWALQRVLATRTSTATRLFQYPRSDRGHCNCTAPPTPTSLLRFQYPRSDRGHCNTGVVGLPMRTVCLTFQYPRSDRGHCNYGSQSSARVSAGMLFQYPRSDRGHCNGDDSAARLSDRDAPFSILGRIVGTATCASSSGAIEQSVSSVGSWALQPRSIAIVGCSRLSVSLGRIVGTATAAAWTRWLAVLSVSSVGSWALQLLVPTSIVLAPAPLSASSVGSWALQQRV